jgi:hypothetical protein
MQQVREAESSGFSGAFTSKTVDRRKKPVEFRKKQCNTSGYLLILSIFIINRPLKAFRTLL